jgi:hypothetical protein
MLNVEIHAVVKYTSELSEEDEKKVRNYSEENNCSLDKAIKELYEKNEIEVYSGREVVSEHNTQEVSYSEFNDEEDLYYSR